MSIKDQKWMLLINIDKLSYPKGFIRAMSNRPQLGQICTVSTQKITQIVNPCFESARAVKQLVKITHGKESGY